eukprot:5606285-Pyramimonas_sp.AAC.2
MCVFFTWSYLESNSPAVERLSKGFVSGVEPNHPPSKNTPEIPCITATSHTRTACTGACVHPWPARARVTCALALRVQRRGVRSGTYRAGLEAPLHVFHG